MWINRGAARTGRGAAAGRLLLAWAGALLVAGALGALGAQGTGPTSGGGLPSGPMQEKARIACLPCHDARIMVQQQLDRRAWARSVDKMIRWGAPVAPEDREPLIDYFAWHFSPRPERESGKLVNATGIKQVRAACLGCHGEQPIVEQRLDRRGWSRLLEREIRWGAPVKAEEKQAILDYLTRHYAPAHR